MRVLLLVLTTVYTGGAFAKVEVQVPILLHTSRGHKTYNISEFRKQLETKNIEIPDFITIREIKDAKVFGSYSDQLDKAALEKPKGNSLYMEIYGTISDYQGPNIEFPMCYRKVGRVSDQKAMEEAFDLAGSLTDSVLSDQYVIAAYRFYGESDFHMESDGQDTGWLDKYKKTELKPGEIQILQTTNDDGDNVAQDILGRCE